MAQEDQPKRQKPKKVPQRGLGVAQLEKIRLEEQHKKDSILTSPPTTHHKKSSYISLPIPSNLQSASQNPIFSPLFSVNVDVAALPGSACVCNNNHNGQKFWSSNNTDKESCGLDPGLVNYFRTNLMSLPYESEPIWPFPSLMQRAQQIQPPSSMVNLSSGTSPFSSVLKFQMELPSNQSYYGNSTALLPEEVKMVGMKRPYPFSLDNAQGPPFHTKHPYIIHPINKQVEEAPSNNGSTFNFEPGTPNFREGPSCSTSNLESESKKSMKQNDQKGVFDGDFLTLAPPTTTLMSSISKFKHPTSSLSYYSYELPDLDSLAYKGSSEDSIFRQGSGSGLNQDRPYYSFLPPAMEQIDRATKISMANCNGGEIGGHVDLNLKL